MLAAFRSHLRPTCLNQQQHLFTETLCCHCFPTLCCCGKLLAWTLCYCFSLPQRERSKVNIWCLSSNRWRFWEWEGSASVSWLVSVTYFHWCNLIDDFVWLVALFWHLPDCVVNQLSASASDVFSLVFLTNPTSVQSIPTALRSSPLCLSCRLMIAACSLCHISGQVCGILKSSFLANWCIAEPLPTLTLHLMTYCQEGRTEDCMWCVF